MSVRDVWFWAPFHMLQAYPIARNLPWPDFFIPFVHLIWVPFYIWEHWTGLCEPVEEAWAMKGLIVPMSGVLLLAFFYTSNKLTDYPIIAGVGTALYFGFMLFAKNFGFTGNPMKTYDEQIAANADPAWNDQHVILHWWYLICLWAVTLTVPFEKLAARKAKAVSEANAPLDDHDPTNTTSPGSSMVEVLKEAIHGSKTLGSFSTLSKTSKFLVLQGVVYASTGLTIFLFPGLFNTLMLYPEPFNAYETPLYRTIGFCVIGIGYFYITASRMNNTYWAVTTIFTRATMTPVSCLTLFFFFGGAPQLCITFAILDPTLAYLTYLSLMSEKTSEGHTPSFMRVLKEAIHGATTLPDFSALTNTAKFLFLQGVVYASTGLTIFLFPGLFNKLMMYPEPFNAYETPLYRTIGFCVIGIGYFYITASRMNHTYWAAATIFTRATMTPVSCLTLFFFFGGAPQLCITFAILDPTLAYLTHLSLLNDAKQGYEAILG